MTPRQKEQKIQNPLEALAERITGAIGSPASIIVHTIIFVAVFSLMFFGVAFDSILLGLTTVLSLEAIYLAIFIQMTVNRNTQSLAEVEEGIDEIAEDVEEIEKDIDEIAEGVEGIEKDIDEIQEDVEEIEKDIDEIQEDVEEVEKDLDRLEEEDIKDDFHDVATMSTLDAIQVELRKLMAEIQTLKEQKKL